ncbi:MAG: hypothetical protein LAT82_05280 [Nanoarchaeota archaeon]|nr:hypothetical protein [Nanoarchaeota archaeon]
MKIKSVDVINKIIFSLKENPKTLSQVANLNSIHWDSAKNYLSQLEEMNIVYKQEINSKEYYILHPNPKSQKNYNTYFNIPITKEIKEKLESYYAIIQEEYKNITNQEPTITQMYKILAKLDKEKQLKLPMCWYSYGLISPLIYNKEEHYEQKVFITTDVKEELTNIITKYSQLKYTRELLIEQYKDFNNQLYIKKEEFLSTLYKKKNFEEIKSTYLEFLEQLNTHTISKETKQYYNTYYTLLLHTKKIITINLEITQNAIEIFKKIFKFVALEEFKRSIIKHKLLNEEILDYIIQQEYDSTVEIIEEELNMFKELIEEELKTAILITPKDFQRGREEDLFTVEEQEKLLKSMNLH